MTSKTEKYATHFAHAMLARDVFNTAHGYYVQWRQKRIASKQYFISIEEESEQLYTLAQFKNGDNATIDDQLYRLVDSRNHVKPGDDYPVQSHD